MCDNCKQFFKTKHEIQQHAYDCVKEEVVGSVEELIERTVSAFNIHSSFCKFVSIGFVWFIFIIDSN